MQIPYKKRHLTINLIIGLLWLAYALIGIYFDPKPRWTHYGWLLVALAYLAYYLYLKKHQYLSITDGFIKENTPFGKKLPIAEMVSIKKFAGDYILKTPTQSLSINGQLLTPESVVILEAELKKWPVEWL